MHHNHQELCQILTAAAVFSRLEYPGEIMTYSKFTASLVQLSCNLFKSFFLRIAYNEVCSRKVKYCFLCFLVLFEMQLVS